MNRQNFDTNSVSNYPLTIDRMAELQEDIQAPLIILANMLRTDEAASRTTGCILSGCEHSGDPGYVMLYLSDGNGGYYKEVFEVEAGSNVATYLVLDERTTTVENSVEVDVDVRFERVLVWAANEPVSGDYVSYANLPRLWVKQAAQDDAGWTLCNNGSWWYAQLNGVTARVKHQGGRVHLWCDVKFGLQISQPGSGSANNHERPGVMDAWTYTLPSGYRPSADVLVPVLFNGTASFAVLNSGGQLLLSQEPELGDTLVIDTFIEQ